MVSLIFNPQSVIFRELILNKMGCGNCLCHKSSKTSAPKSRGIDKKAVISVFGSLEDVSEDVAIRAFNMLSKNESKGVDF
jgi:hypothetical protein